MTATHTDNLVIKGVEFAPGKAQWINIGKIFKDNYGGIFIQLNAAYLSSQLNHIANPDRKQFIVGSVFPVKDYPAQSINPIEQNTKRPPQNVYKHPASKPPLDDFEDDIPF